MPSDLFLKTAAVLSACKLYRYRLSRIWEPALGLVNFIMLNPSTADAEQNDPTINRCLGYAESWGYGGLIVTNLFAFRATNPSDMVLAKEPIGNPANDEYILQVAAECKLIVCGWGEVGCHQNRSEIVRKRLVDAGHKPHVLKFNKSGQPTHPLYLLGSYQPKPWLEVHHTT